VLFVEGTSSKICRDRPSTLVQSAFVTAWEVTGWNALTEADI
jgi:hypothetical protein